MAIWQMAAPWKTEIIALTELPEARARKIDASFFPPVSPAQLAAWEQDHSIFIPEEIRSFIQESDGLEASRGDLWPVLPLNQWEVIRDECASSHAWIRFGEDPGHRYLLSLGHSPTIYRHEYFGSDETFFARDFRQFLRKVFKNES